MLATVSYTHLDVYKRQVDECIQKGILADFLRVTRAEVIDMSIFASDKEEEEKKLQATYEKQGELRKMCIRDRNVSEQGTLL